MVRLEREKEIGMEEKLVEEMERMQVEEVRLGKRERELEGLLREYELEGGRDGLEVFRMLGERFAEVEGERRYVRRIVVRNWRRGYGGDGDQIEQFDQEGLLTPGVGGPAAPRKCA